MCIADLLLYVFRECTVDQQGNVCRNTGHVTGKKHSSIKENNTQDYYEGFFPSFLTQPLHIRHIVLYTFLAASFRILKVAVWLFTLIMHHYPEGKQIFNCFGESYSCRVEKSAQNPVLRIYQTDSFETISDKWKLSPPICSWCVYFYYLPANFFFFLFQIIWAMTRKKHRHFKLTRWENLNRWAS